MVYTFIDHRNDVKMFKTQVESYEHFDVIYKIQNVNNLFVCLFVFSNNINLHFLTSKIERVLGKKKQIAPDVISMLSAFNQSPSERDIAYLM